MTVDFPVEEESSRMDVDSDPKVSSPHANEQLSTEADLTRRDLSQMRVESIVSGGYSQQQDMSPVREPLQRTIDNEPPQANGMRGNNIDMNLGIRQTVGGELSHRSHTHGGDTSSSQLAYMVPSQTNGFQVREPQQEKGPKHYNITPAKYPERFHGSFGTVPVLHHLDSSNSQAILWTLEELDLAYVLIKHTRNENFGEPLSLACLGIQSEKTPALLTQKKGRAIFESCHIVSYLIRTFDYNDRFGLKRNKDNLDREDNLSAIYTEFNRAVSNLLRIEINRTAEKDCFQVNQDFDRVRFCLSRLAEEYEAGKDHRSGRFFMGPLPGRADVLLEWPMTVVHQRIWIDLTREYPNLYEWLQAIYSRPSWIRAYERGSDYNLRGLPNRGQLARFAAMGHVMLPPIQG